MNYGTNPQTSVVHSKYDEMKESFMEKMSYYEADLEKLQDELKSKKIIILWNKFRNCENKKDGQIPHEAFMSYFKDEFPKLQPEILEYLFQRFNYEDNDSVDIYDCLISLAILSKINNKDKLDLIFKLMDVDEDNCLSIQDVFKMIFTIEKNFVKEINSLDFQSESLFNEIAITNCMMKFRILALLFSDRDKNNAENNPETSKQPDPSQSNFPKIYKQDLITNNEFIDALKMNKGLFDGFLPQNYQLKQFMVTRYNELEIGIYSKYQDNFKDFRNQLHQKLRGYDDGKPPKQTIETKVPGKMKVLGEKNRHDDHGNGSNNLLNNQNRGAKGRFNKPKEDKKSTKDKNTFHQQDEYLTMTLDQMRPQSLSSNVVTEKNFEVNNLNSEEDTKDEITRIKENTNKISRQHFSKLVDMQEMKIDTVSMQQKDIGKEK